MEFSTQILIQIGRLEAKLDQVLRIVSQNSPARNGHPDLTSHNGNAALVALSGLTVRQHAALQMLLNGKSNAEIAERLGVSENTAKVHVRLIAKKIGVAKRQQIVGFFRRVFDDIAEDDYRTLSRGLPKDWDASGGRIDEFVTAEGDGAAEA